ncbi:MAG: hypothetical protein ACYS0E_10080, partial [Planctomycetota bacterium]
SRLAWILATVPPPALREPTRAIELAKRAVQLGPQAANNWRTLGVAHWYASDPEEAERALRKSVRLHKRGGGPHDWLFLAMTNAKLERKEEAKTWLAKAVRWMAEHQPKDAQMDRFRSEAEKLLEE